MRLEDYKVKDILEYLRNLNLKFDNENPIISEIQESLRTLITIREKEQLNNNDLLFNKMMSYENYMSHISFTEGLKQTLLIIERIYNQRMIK